MGVTKVPRTARDRVRKRLARLELVGATDHWGHSADSVAHDHRERLWTARGHQRDAVLLRPGLVLRNGSELSPIRAVAGQQSAAVQLLLVALFVAHCRRPARAAGQPTPILLRDPPDSTGTAWRRLVALPTHDASRRTATRTAADNQVAQLRTALTRLYDAGRVNLPKSSGRGRFERFQLLDEAAPRTEASVPYTIPRPDSRMIEVPSSFFLNGWVHALNDDEIIAYLFLLLLAQHTNPDPDGITIPQEMWSYAFDKPRAHSTAYRMLHRCGLIRAVRSAVRREDGTIEGYNSGEMEYTPSEAMRFFMNPEALDRPALPIVRRALKGMVDGVGLDQAWNASRDSPDTLPGQQAERADPDRLHADQGDGAGCGGDTMLHTAASTHRHPRLVDQDGTVLRSTGRQRPTSFETRRSVNAAETYWT